MSIHVRHTTPEMTTRTPLDLENDAQFRGYLEFIQHNRRMSILLPLFAHLFLMGSIYVFMYLLPALHDWFFYPERSQEMAKDMPEIPLLRLLFPLPGMFLIASMLMVIISGILIVYTRKSIRAMKKSIDTFSAPRLTKDNGGEVYRIIENMALTLGIPMPRIFLLNTSARNALTIGFSPDSSLLLITRGLLESLNRPEFEAVIAHAFANVRLHNTSFISRLQGFFGPLVDEMIRNHRITGFQAHVLLALLMGTMIVIFVALPQAALTAGPLVLGFGIVAPLVWMKEGMLSSRTKLTDALALEVTKDPHAYVSALLKVAGHDRLTIRNGSLLESLKFYGRDAGMLKSHPPLQERIREILTTWRLKAATPLPAGMPEIEQLTALARDVEKASRRQETFELDLGLQSFEEFATDGKGPPVRPELAPYAFLVLMIGILLMIFIVLKNA